MPASLSVSTPSVSGPAPRARTRRALDLQVDLTRDEKLASMKDALRRIAEFASAESAARSAKDKLTKQLEKDMTALDVASIQQLVDNVVWEGRIWSGDPTNVVDPAKLYEKITPQQFLTVVKVSAGDVKDAFGTHTLNQVLVEKQGEVKLRVTKVK